MNVLGIVAEFNPFHNGHQYLIDQAAQNTHFAGTLCVMSGNFVQRGEPAICDKWARAEMALYAGVDLVIELPFCFAARSAYYFARGALQLLLGTGVVTHLAFGSECGNINILQNIASLLSREPEEYKILLKYHLDKGLNFPHARANALSDYLGHKETELQSILLGSNNILAIEYLRIIAEYGLPVQPFTISRHGSSYNNMDLNPFASAKAIRDAILAGREIEKLADTMPVASFNLFKNYLQNGRAPGADEYLEPAMLFRLRTLSATDLHSIYEISEGLEYRIKEAANRFGTLQELKRHIKSKRYSYTRINRTLLYILFGLSKNRMNQFDQDGPMYLHVLGFSAKGQKILREIKNKSPLKLLIRGSDIRAALSDSQKQNLGDMLSLDVLASDIYSLLIPEPSLRQTGKDFTCSPIIVS